MAVIPAPVVVQPSGGFYGDAGSWSTFTMRVGTPAQDFQVLPSTFIRESWVISTQGCGVNDAANCNVLRGGLFNVNASTTWQDQHGYTLGSESNLGYTNNQDIGEYGYDTVGISSPGVGGFTLDSQVVAAIFTTDFYLGYLGISPRDVNFNNDPKPSFVGSLKKNNMIPSLSYGYTAGASYMNTTGSLTFGGYDASRFTPNNISFTIAPNPYFDLVVGLQSISFSDSASSEVSLLSPGDGILALVDSTVPDLWLPAEVCKAFEQAFGISLDPIHALYIVNDTLHEQLLKQNASVTFKLGNSIAGGSTVDIVLPYSSFDLMIGYPLLSNTTRYFPLRQATASTQYTLGRTILQEIFLIADYERNNFSISQCVFPPPETPHIIAIKSINDTTGAGTGTSTGTTTTSPSVGISTSTSSTSPSSTAIVITHTSHSLPTSAIAGIAIAIIALAIIIAGFVGCRVYRNRRSKNIRNMPELPGPESKIDPDDEDLYRHPAYAFNKNKTDGGVRETTNELDGSQIRKSLRPGPNVIEVPHGAVVEMPPGIPRSEMESPEPVPGRMTSYQFDLPSPDPSFPDVYPSPPEPEEGRRFSPDPTSPDLASQSIFPLSSPHMSAFQSPTLGHHTRFDSQSSDGLSLNAGFSSPFFLNASRASDVPSPGPSPTPESSLMRSQEKDR